MLWQNAKRAFDAAEAELQLATEKLDVTLPGRRQSIGSLHPVTRTIERIEAIFTGAGFKTVEGPEIEDGLSQFRGAEYSGTPSSTRYARHVLL
jgi:phenylalanyl-tRNA synthetase alpha chain